MTLGVHDHTIYAYQVLCERREIVLHTYLESASTATAWVDVCFGGVLGHCFDCVLEGNVLFDICETPAQEIIRDHREWMESQRPFGWPAGIEWASIDELERTLTNRGIRAFRLDSSYGMTGLILAESVRTTNRSSKYNG